MPSGNEVQGFSSISGRAEGVKFSGRAAFTRNRTGITDRLRTKTDIVTPASTTRPMVLIPSYHRLLPRTAVSFGSAVRLIPASPARKTGQSLPGAKYGFGSLRADMLVGI